MASRFFGSRREKYTEQIGAGIIGELKTLAISMTGAGIVEVVPGWLYCNGVAISRATYEALFTAIGTAYGVGDGSTTFNIPDYRGRSIIAAPDGQVGATRATAATRGTVVGAETVTLTTAQLPVHTHTLTGSPSLSGSPTLSGAPALTGVIARSGSVTGSITGTPSISDPGHTHPAQRASFSGGSWAFGSGASTGGSPSTIESATTGITAGVGTLGVSVTDGLTVNNGTLATGVGTLAAGVGTLATAIGSLAASNTGSGTAVPNLHPAQGAGGVIIRY